MKRKAIKFSLVEDYLNQADILIMRIDVLKLNYCLLTEKKMS